MAFPSISVTNGQSTPFDQLLKEGQIQRRAFCFILNQQSNLPIIQGIKIGGEIQIGGCDYQPTVWIPLIKAATWMFQMSGVVVQSVDGRTLRVCQYGCDAIMDTGTSLIVGPENEIVAINNMLGAQMNEKTGEYFINYCNDRYLSTLPAVTLFLGGESFTLTSADYIIKLVSELIFGQFSWTFFFFCYNLCRMANVCPVLCQSNHLTGFLVMYSSARESSISIWTINASELHQNHKLCYKFE